MNPNKKYTWVELKKKFSGKMMYKRKVVDGIVVSVPTKACQELCLIIKNQGDRNEDGKSIGRYFNL